MLGRDLHFMCVSSCVLCVLTWFLCVCMLCERADVFVFTDGKRQAVAAYTAVYGWQGSRLGETCVFKVYTSLIMLI